MRAEYQDFNGEWFKDCNRCKSYYSSDTLLGLSAFFTKDKNKLDGYDHCCKNCKKQYREKNKEKELIRWKKYYTKSSENRKRHMVRSQTRRKYGSAKEKKCEKCGEQAFEWHHLEYKTDSVIAVCSPCHESL